MFQQCYDRVTVIDSVKKEVSTGFKCGVYGEEIYMWCECIFIECRIGVQNSNVILAARDRVILGVTI